MADMQSLQRQLLPALGTRRTSEPSLLIPHFFPVLSPWSPQIGQWHVADGLSMDSRLYASNISDSLFNTTLVVTTILVSRVLPGLPAVAPRGASSSARPPVSFLPGNERREL